MNYIELETTPVNEPCVQVSSYECYLPQMREEALRYLQMLQVKFVDFIQGDMYLGIKKFPHDFGSYLDVCIYYNPESKIESQLAVYICNNLPKTWEDTQKPPKEDLEEIIKEG